MIPDFFKKFNHEMIVVDGKIKLIEIKLIEFTNFPKELIEKLQNYLAEDQKAINALEEMGVKGFDKLEKFAACRFGGFDDKADISDETIIPDHLNCPHRGHCLGEGKVCLNLKGKHGILTPRELEYAIFTAQDYGDKMIAHKMGISIHTVNIYRKSVSLKTGSHSKAGIATFIAKKNLV